MPSKRTEDGERKTDPKDTRMTQEIEIMFLFIIILLDLLKKAMATHSSVLAWRIPGTGEPAGLPSMGLRRVGHD